jgi:hypothetical protein
MQNVHLRGGVAETAGRDGAAERSFRELDWPWT